MTFRQSATAHLRHTGHFLLRFGVPTLITVFLVGFLLYSPQSDGIVRPVDTQNSSGENFYAVEESMAYDMAEPRMAKSMAIRSDIMPPIDMGDGFSPDSEQKIIRNASLGLEVKDAENTKQQAEAAIKALGGAVTNSNCYEHYQTKSLACNITFRVPADQLDTALSTLAAMGIKKSESTNANDITAQYQDTQSQLKNLEIRRDRLRQLAERESDNLGELLQIDRELSSVQTQIDNLTRTQIRRDTDVSYSQLSLSLTPAPQLKPIADDEWNISRVWKQSVNNLTAKTQHIAERAIELVALAPIWLPLLIILLLVRRRFMKKRKQ